MKNKSIKKQKRQISLLTFECNTSLAYSIVCMKILNHANNIMVLHVCLFLEFFLMKNYDFFLCGIYIYIYIYMINENEMGRENK